MPDGHTGGDSFVIELPDGTEIDIDTPEGLVAGDVFEIELNDDDSTEPEEEEEEEGEEFSDSEWDDARAGDALGTSRDNHARRAMAQAADQAPKKKQPQDDASSSSDDDEDDDDIDAMAAELAAMADDGTQLSSPLKSSKLELPVGQRKAQ